MDSRGVLLHYETKSKEIFNSSGLMLNHSIILTTGSCLTPFIQNCLENNKTINSQTLNELLTISIQFESPDPADLVQSSQVKRINTYKSEHKKKLNNLNGTIVNLYQCPQIKTAVESSLPDWDINNAKDVKNQSEICKDFLLSTIVIIQINNKIVNVNNILKQLLISLVPINYLERGDVVYLETTPFANKTFLNTLSEGVIANTIGAEQCIFLTDASAAPGSEGGPIFLKLKGNNG